VAKVAFTVDNGIRPSTTDVGDVGTNSLRFLNLYLAGSADIDTDLTVDGTVTMPNFSGGGGGANEATIIAYATALAY